MRKPGNSRTIRQGSLAVTLLASLLLIFGGLGLAQERPGVGVAVDFPEVGSLEISAVDVEFDLQGAKYPPAEFPAYYRPVGPGSESEPIVLTVTSNTSSWQLEATFTGLVMYDGNLQFQLPIDQLEYRLDGLNWLSFPAVNSSTILMLTPRTGTDAIAAPQSHALELRLKVTGNEAPGSYEGTLIFSLTSQ